MEVRQKEYTYISRSPQKRAKVYKEEKDVNGHKKKLEMQPSIL